MGRMKAKSYYYLCYHLEYTSFILIKKSLLKIESFKILRRGVENTGEPFDCPKIERVGNVKFHSKNTQEFLGSGEAIAKRKNV